MGYHIDTTVLIPYFAGDQTTIVLLEQLATSGIAVSILSYLEAYQGAMEKSDPESACEQLEAFFVNVPILPVSRAVAQRCAGIRSLLKRQGKSSRQRAFDLVIAATALEHSLEVVTHNVRDFADIPDLMLYQL